MQNLFDILNFLKKFSFIKFSNIVILNFSFLVSKILNKIIVYGKPHTITIEPTNRCNLSCPECPAGTKSLERETGNITTELYERIISESAKYTSNLILYFQGEPFLHKNFINLVDYANNKNIYVSTSTNAQLLTGDYAKKIVQSGLDRLIVSLDGTSQESYESYRVGGDLQKTIEGIKHIVKWKKDLNSRKPFLICQFLILKQNEHQIYEAKILANELGVDKIVFKTAQFYDFRNGNFRIPENEKFTRYIKNKNNNYTIKTTKQKLCFRLWSNMVITWNGNVNLCCFDKDSEYSVGSVNNASLTKIWKGEKITAIRKSFLTKIAKPDICSNCTNGIQTYVKI